MTPKARVGRPPKSAAAPKKEKHDDFVPPSDEEDIGDEEDEEEEEDYEDEEDEDFDLGNTRRHKSGGSTSKYSRRSSAGQNTTQPSQMFNNTSDINANINNPRTGLTSSIDSMQSNISSLLTNITDTPSVGAYKPPLIFGNTVSPADINWNYVATKTPTAPIVNTYNDNQTLLLANNALKRTSGQLDTNTVPFGFQPEGQPQLKRQRLDEAELLMGLLPTTSTNLQQPPVNMSSSVNMSPSVRQSLPPMLPQPMSHMPYSVPQPPLSYQQNPFAQAPPVFSTQSVMNMKSTAPLTASTSSLNSQPINLFASDELPQSTPASQVSAANSQDIDQFLNLGPDTDTK